MIKIYPVSDPENTVLDGIIPLVAVVVTFNIALDAILDLGVYPTSRANDINESLFCAESIKLSLAKKFVYVEKNAVL